MSVLPLSHLSQALPVDQMGLKRMSLFRIQFDHGLHKPVPLAINGWLIDQFARHGVETLVPGAVVSGEGVLKACLRDAEMFGQTWL